MLSDAPGHGYASFLRRPSDSRGCAATNKRFCLRTLQTAERQKEIIKTSEAEH